MDTASAGKADTARPTTGFVGQWNHRPPVPIEVSPFFTWPPKPARMLRWVTDRWFILAENAIVLAVACISWFWFQPPHEETKTFAFSGGLQRYMPATSFCRRS